MDSTNTLHWTRGILLMHMDTTNYKRVCGSDMYRKSTPLCLPCDLSEEGIKSKRVEIGQLSKFSHQILNRWQIHKLHFARRINFLPSFTLIP